MIFSREIKQLVKFYDQSTSIYHSLVWPFSDSFDALLANYQCTTDFGKKVRFQCCFWYGV